jgi:hypothetical protein
VRIGPLYTPRLTLMVLRIGDREHAVRGMLHALRTRGRFEHFDWCFSSQCEDNDERVGITARFSAPSDHFVRLRYANPPGGDKICWNTKLARAEVTLSRRGEAPRQLVSRQRAAFEILEDEARRGS